MTFLYPPDLIDHIKRRWNRAHEPRQHLLVIDSKGRRLKRPKPLLLPGIESWFPFPSDESLSCMLGVLYHSSFLTEESRRIAVRVTYLPPHLFEKGVLKHLGTVTRLLEPRPVSPAELLRLAPAVDPSRSIILLSDSAGLGLAGGPPLAAWGLLHHGSEWSELVSGRGGGATCPPDSLTVSTFAPGDLTVSCRGSVLLRLREGTLLDASTIALDEGAVGDFLKLAADALYTGVCTTLKRKQYSEFSDSDGYPRDLYYKTLLNILLRTRERHHGGSFVIVPDELDMADSRLSDRIAIKYSVDAALVWDDLIDESVVHAELTDLLSHPEDVPPARRRPVAKRRADPEAVYQVNAERGHLRDRIHDFGLFAASLSGVDGAVVMTRRLKILGFGGEITATSPALSSVRLAADAGGQTGESVPITSFGTRHRSAFRFCSSFEDSVCFVVSQDGQVKGIKRVGPQLVMWNDLTAKRQVL